MTEDGLVYLILALFSIAVMSQVGIWNKIDSIASRINQIEGRVKVIELVLKVRQIHGGVLNDD